eukprot:Sdes_comp20948_c0_seq1m18570
MPKSRLQAVENLSLLDIIELFVEKIISFFPAAETIDEFLVQLFDVPVYHLIFETILALFALKLLFSKSYQPGKFPKLQLKSSEIDELCAEWSPEPLVPADFLPDPDDEKIIVVESAVSEKVIVGGKEMVNLASFNFLGMIGDPEIQKSALSAIQKYGVGSCGPRGFYGTSDIHLELEEKICKFFGTEETVIYSYGFATIASAIPAYSKRGDIIFVDEAVSLPIQKGILASKSEVKYFNHNNMGDLERLLLQQANLDAKNMKRAKTTRKFLVVEGLYLNTGDICPLDKLVALKNKYKLYFFVEESASFGVLGKTGRGVCEHFGIAHREVDLLAANLEYAIGSIGGFCTGSSYVINHQRLSSSGYVFSAANPPLLSAVAISALNKLQADVSLLRSLRENTQLLRKRLNFIEGVKILGDISSPIIYMQLVEKRSDAKHLLQLIVDQLLENCIVLTRAKHIHRDESHPIPPSIRITVSARHSPHDLENCATLIKKCVEKILRTH